MFWAIFMFNLLISLLSCYYCGDLNNQDNKVDDSFWKTMDIFSCLFFQCVNSHHRLDESSFRHGSLFVIQFF